MSSIAQSIKRAAQRIYDDENIRDGVAHVVGALIGIVVTSIKRR